MSYTAVVCLVLALVGTALIVFRVPLSKLQIMALISFDHFKKNPAIHLRRLQRAAIIFGVLFIALGVVWYFAN